MKTFVTIVVAAAALIGCSSTTVPAEKSAALAPADAKPRDHAPVRAPYVLTLEGPARAEAGETVKVVARLELHAAAPAPVALSIDLPDGAAESENSLAVEIPAGTEGTVEHSWELLVLEPSAPVSVTAQMKGEGFGATARRELSFDGRSDKPASPARPGARLLPTD